jgi:DNA repair exonuclease SbcCD ATPase subunit
MKLLYLSIQDFGPFSGVQGISFEGKSPLIMVTAEYSGAPGRSNRAGKSTILDAIVYLLYGECRVREVDFIHYGAPEMVVSGTFEFESGEQMVIKRGRTSKNEAIFEVNGQTGSRLQSEIDKHLGISYKDFITTNYFQQLDMHNFMEAGATEKQKLLSQWLGNDYWKKYEDAVKEELDELSTEMTKNSIALSALETSESAPNPEARLVEAKAKQDTLNAQVKQLRSEDGMVDDGFILAW